MERLDKDFIFGSCYKSGYFLERSLGYKDAEFKSKEFKDFIRSYTKLLFKDKIRVADVGCGCGNTTFLIRDTLKELGFNNIKVYGYDIHPQILKFKGDKDITFIRKSIGDINKKFDLVVLLDVIEHIHNPIESLKKIAKNAKFILLHIPLEDCWLVKLRNLFRMKLSQSGHLIFLDVCSALNLVAMAGIRTIDYRFNPGYTAPSGRQSILQKIAYPWRKLLYLISPSLLQATLGGVSLMVLGYNPNYNFYGKKRLE